MLRTLIILAIAGWGTLILLGLACQIRTWYRSRAAWRERQVYKAVRQAYAEAGVYFDPAGQMRLPLRRVDSKA